MTKRSRKTSGSRIAILSPSLAGQGAERKALYIAAGLLERGHEVDLLLQRFLCHYPEEIPKQARIFFSSDQIDAKTREYLGRIAAIPRPTCARSPSLANSLPAYRYVNELASRINCPCL